MEWFHPPCTHQASTDFYARAKHWDPKKSSPKVLAEQKERRDTLLFNIFSRSQSAARMWTARWQMEQVFGQAIAIRTIQRNARTYDNLRDWSRWQLYTMVGTPFPGMQVRPLLAATRNDEELQRKELKLTLAKERAEIDQQTRKALERVKVGLQNEKGRVEGLEPR